MSGAPPDAMEDTPTSDARPSDSGDAAAGAASLAGASSAAIAAAASASHSGPDLVQLQLVQEPGLRFRLELEFVSLLSNPHYLHFLAQARYLTDPAFLNYLLYLQYWHKPAYLPYLTHPHALYFLDLLLLPAFRLALLNPAYVSLLFEQQFYHWKSDRFNRQREAEQRKEQAMALAAKCKAEEEAAAAAAKAEGAEEGKASAALA